LLTLFSFNALAPTDIVTLSLHDALPIWLTCSPEFCSTRFCRTDPGMRGVLCLTLGSVACIGPVVASITQGNGRDGLWNAVNVESVRLERPGNETGSHPARRTPG